MRHDHIGIKVNDMDVALDFYTRVMGLEVLETFKLMGNDYYFVGNEDIKIELEPAPKNSQPPDLNRSTGMSHVAFLVNDVDAEAKRLEGLGVKFIIKPVRLQPGRKMAYIEDPDGTRIQLTQVLEE